jgi:hypothetical protein
MAAMPPLEIVGDWRIQDGCLIQGMSSWRDMEPRFGDPVDRLRPARGFTLGPVWANESLVGRADGYNRCEYILPALDSDQPRFAVFAANQTAGRPHAEVLPNQSPIADDAWWSCGCAARG